MNSNELAHYGILGMKWGVRRTPAQLARARSERRSTSNSQSKGTSSSSSTKKKSIKDMTDDELTREVTRLQLEQRYRQLNPEKVSLGKRFTDKVAKDVVVPAVTNVARNTLQNALQKAFDSALNGKKKK